MMATAEQILHQKHIRGEAITPIDHIPTIKTEDELEGFRAGLAKQQALTPEILGAIERRRTTIRAARR